MVASPSPARPPTRPVRAVLLGICTGALLLGALEAALALAGLPDPGLYEGDPATAWFLRPELDRVVPGPDGPFRVRTDARGLRREAPEAPRILALGCSTTFGWGVEDGEAWPARLAALTGQAVANGGQPGWSTHQAVLGVSRYADLHPEGVILAFGVRDATPARRPDHEARPTPWLQRTHLFRLTRSGGAPGSAPTPQGDTFRVPPEIYAANLHRLVADLAPARVVLLAFPQREPATPWVDALRGVAAAVGIPAWTPTLPDDAFFPTDPMHLTPRGHDLLAAEIARMDLP